MGLKRIVSLLDQWPGEDYDTWNARNDFFQTYRRLKRPDPSEYPKSYWVVEGSKVSVNIVVETWVLLAFNEWPVIDETVVRLS